MLSLYNVQLKHVLARELNELLSVRMADTGVFAYDYDPSRNRIRQTDGNGHVVAFTYDALNRMELMIQDPDDLSLTTDHDYDPNGNEILLTDPKGQEITFDYDPLNRMEAKIYQLTAGDFEVFFRTHRVDYEYDANDNLIRVDELRSSGTDPPATFVNTKTYDLLDRLESETDSFGRALEYRYDGQGNRTLLRDPDNKETVYTYDDLNRLETLTTEAGQTVYTYFPDGLKQTVTNPNGTLSTFGYDAADRMTTIDHQGPGGTISAYEYTYDSNGNRLSQVETNAGRTENTTYTYDPVNRLATVTYPDRAVEYDYDLAGNRVQEVTTGAEPSDKTFHYDAINRLDSITDTSTGTELTAYTFDANGNTTSKTTAGVTTDFLFDIRDQLGEVQQGASILGRYGYDYDGRRILKIGADGRRHYTYDQLSVITEADQVNTTVSKYHYGLDQLVSLSNRSEGRSFFHLDILGSTVNLTQPNGTARQSIFYDAWGNERERIGTSANNFTFTGHELDEETGLIYAKARFYDADVGRFLTQDRFLGHADSPPSLHRYVYVNDNPLKFFDPTGNFSFEAFGRGFLNVIAEPVREIQDITRVTGGRILDIPPEYIELRSMVGKQAQRRVEEGQGRAVSATKGVGEVAFAIGTFGVGPFVQGQTELALALNRGEITIHEYDEGLSQLAGGATAVALLASIAKARASRGLPAGQGKPVANTVTEPSGPATEPSATTAKATGLGEPQQLALPFPEGPVGKGAPPSARAATTTGTGRAPASDFGEAPSIAEEALQPLFKRPSSFRKSTEQGVRQTVPRSEEGEMSCPTCREVMPERTTVQTKRGPVQRRGFDIDHFERTWAQRVAEMKQKALDTGRVPTRKEILDAYNSLVRAQCPSCNRSHRFEGLPEQLLLLPGETQQAPLPTGKNQ